jgi:UDP-N-acetylglucosamine acyltransferase
MPLIHPTALVSPLARLADDVEIGPFSVIEGPATLAAGVRIDGHVLLRSHVELGPNTKVGWGSVLGADPQDLSFDPSIRSFVRIGPDNTLREYVTIHRGSRPDSETRLGSGNFLMIGAHLAHDVLLGDQNILANNVLLAGHVRVGHRAFLGGGAAFHQFLRIGDLAIVQGNAAVSQDVPPYCAVHGQNCLAGLNVIGLRRAGFDAAARAEIKALYRLLFQSRLPLSQAIAEAATRDWSPAARLLLDAAASPSRKGVISR